MTTMTFVDVSVVIGTFQLLDKLMLTLDSFTKQTFPTERFEVIVVDSESNDGTAVFLKGYQPSFNLRYFSQSNRGKSAARNRGVKESRGRLIILTDADMIASPQFIDAHVRLHAEFSRPILVQGKTWVLSHEALPLERVRRRPYITRRVHNKQKLDFYYCLTGNLSLPRTLFLDAGGLDESLQGYGWEDIDLGFRLIKKRGLCLYYAEEAVTDHFHVWTESEERKRRYNMGLSVGGLLKKHPSLKNFLGVHIINRFIYRLVLLVPAWRNLANSPLSEDNISRFKVFIFREYYYQLGILASKHS